MPIETQALTRDRHKNVAGVKLFVEIISRNKVHFVNLEIPVHFTLRFSCS